MNDSFKTPPVLRVGLNPMLFLHSNSDNYIFCNVNETFLFLELSQQLQKNFNHAQVGSEPEHTTILHLQYIVPVRYRQSKTNDQRLLRTSDTTTGLNNSNKQKLIQLSRNSNLKQMDSELGFDVQRSFLPADLKCNACSRHWECYPKESGSQRKTGIFIYKTNNKK